MTHFAPHRVIYDTDPGVDDAMALYYALAHPDIDVLGVTTTFGNVTVAQAARNALYLLAIAGRSQIPVTQGVAAPLVKAGEAPPDHIHGADGLGNLAQRVATHNQVDARSSAQFIVDMARQHPGEITVVAVGPLGNLALALALEPELPRLLRKVVVMGGAVMTGMVATDRRTTGSQLEDEGLELKVGSAIRQELGDSVHLNVTSFNKRVLMTGEVRTQALKERAEKLAQSQENIQSVVNDLAVAPPSSLMQRSKDTVITSQVKAAFIDAKDLQVNSIKVVTERGIVYLMGRVTAREAKRASDIVRGIGGVVKVVRVFETITEEELKRISAQPLSPQAQPKI